MSRCGSWSVAAEPAVLPVTGIAYPGDLEVTAPGSGIVFRAPNGTYYRMSVDDDGALETDVVAAPVRAQLDYGSVCPVYASDLYVDSSSRGLVVWGTSGLELWRIRADLDGALLTELVAPGWIGLDDAFVRPISGGSVTFDRDVYVNLVGAGLLVTTPNGVNVYRVRVDDDGALITELI